MENIRSFEEIAIKDTFDDLYATICNTSGIRHPAEELILVPAPNMPIEAMASNPINLRFLQMLVRMTGAKRILEVGSFIGISAMYMAKGSGAVVVTLEKGEDFSEIARRNVKQNGFEGSVSVHWAEVNSLDPGAILDMAFIDGGKESYPEIFQAIEPMIRPGGLIVVDDIMFHGDARSGA